MKSCELVVLVSSLACCIAEGRSSDEITLLGSIFSQLGDTLETISAQQAICCDNKDEKDTSC
ncbi:DUF6774 domain-containing protein [Clostridium sp. Marseille-P2415]|uniref:DUF6774 domain-containing protein n=1 Tax=Clostridium sp. Marseille-P2415 TaxID=1805471 RepID=UPI00098861F8|nr:DUF6774 domain-containing protein [Clostridium sp. Marseille-P2415]